MGVFSLGALKNSAVLNFRFGRLYEKYKLSTPTPLILPCHAKENLRRLSGLQLCFSSDGERRSCCSHHGGVCSCKNERAVCCDGQYSATCGCNSRDISNGLENSMRPSLRLSLVLMAVILLCACSTPYQRDGFRGGHSDLLLDSNTYRVSFRGNGYTSSDKVETYLLYRCAELTVNKGFDYFVIIDRNAEARQSLYTTSGTFSSSTSFSGNAAYTSGSYSPGVTIPITRHRATVMIKTFKGVKPDMSGAFTAKELRDNLRSQVSGLDADSTEIR
jgi:hypothetical protein